MFARYPSRTVTGAAADALPVPLLVDVELGLLELAEEQPATRSAPPATAATPAKILRISTHSLSVK
jgi:hypothetical protein